MPVDSTSFVFIIALAGVVNGLGIVRWLTGFTEFLRNRSPTPVSVYWVYALAACFQFLLHILFWWSLWDFRGSATINFVSYLYLLSGPILLFLGTALLMPNGEKNEIDLKSHYFSVRPSYTTVLILLWSWALFLSPVLRGAFGSSTPVFVAFLANAAAMRVTANPMVHAVSVIANWVLFVVLVGLNFLTLGGQ